MKLNKFCRKIMSAALSCLVFNAPLTARGEFLTDETSTDYITQNSDYYTFEPVNTAITSYSDYYDMYAEEKRPEFDILINGTGFSSTGNGSFSTGSYTTDGISRDKTLMWESSGGNAACTIDVPQTGLYALEISYAPLISNSSRIELSMKIDGELPFDSASRLTLNRVWVNETDIKKDSRGNEIRPAQIQQSIWQKAVISDPDGLSSQPLLFYLEKGSHEISFTSERAEFVIDYLRFFTPDELPSYEEYESSVNASGSDNTRLIRIEGEDALYKSDASLSPASDNTSYNTSPSDPVKLLCNTIGKDSWKKAMQTVTWEISEKEIGSGGWFRLGIKARQNQMRGFFSNRRIYIDGEVPCKELDCVEFFYDTDWNVTTPRTENGGDVYVYLEGGQAHTITMECVTGEIGDSLRRLENAVDELNECYRKIIMITGPSPDKYTDYYVHEKIDGLIVDFVRISTEFKAVQADIEALSGTSGSEAAILDSAAVILDKCIDKPLKITDYLSQIKSNIGSITAWVREYRGQPLELDYIELAGKDTNFTDCNEKLGKSLSFGIKSFFGSFFEDYTTLSDVKDEEAVEVWVALGRDQAQIIKEMTENEFIPEYDIPISINLVTGGIVEASLAGKGPDAALFLGGEFPVNLAARDLLVDVSRFPDFNNVSEQFQENALTHYEYSGGTYGLPVSQSFPMMFCRTDILTELGYTSPPETWAELIDMLPAIQRNYMNVGLVLPPANISPATESGHTFAMLMLQKGENYYNNTLTASTFDSIGAVQSFEEWTDFYTKYSFEQSYDAFTRFRTGECPIVIQNYTFANQLEAAAPEISGLWEFFPVPGTEQADGTISHAANSSGSGAVIFNSTENINGAWKFIKWFTSADTQAEYAMRTEGLLGTLGRFDTANKQALSQLSWSAKELERLYAQQSELMEIPVLPSSYAVTRNIMNAFRETVNEGENPRDTLIWYNRDINGEIERKRENLEKYKD